MMVQPTTSTPYDYANCPHRLPCGICRLTNSPCNYGYIQIEPTWTCSDATASCSASSKQFGLQKENNINDCETLS